MDDPQIAMEMTAVKEEIKEEPDNIVENDEKDILWQVSPPPGDTSLAVVTKENDSEEEEVKPPLTVFLSPEQHLEEYLQKKDPLALDALCKDIPLDNKFLIKQETELHIEEETFNETERDISCPANEFRSPAEKILGVDCDFGPKVQLVEMERDGATKNKGAFECRICKKRLAAKCSLIRHVLGHTAETPPQSADVRSWLETLKKRTSCPRGVAPLDCPVCGFHCLGKIGLNAHMRMHRVETPYECPYCGKGFRKESTLTTHTRTHAGKRVYTCYICEKEFRQNCHLTQHIAVMHTGERQYTCSTCGKQFSSHQHLIAHSRSHPGRGPFECSTCGKRYLMMSGLFTHNRTHYGERPYECSVCGKCFEEQSHLDDHWGVHMEERPFKSITDSVDDIQEEGHVRVRSAVSGTYLNTS